MRLKQPKEIIVILFVMTNAVLALPGVAQRAALSGEGKWLDDGKRLDGIPNSVAGPSQTLWIGTTGSWFNAGNWSAGVPIATTDVQVNNGGTPQAGAPSDFLTAHNVILGFDTSNSGNLSVINGIFESTGSITVGRAGTGMLSFGNADLTSQAGVIGELSGSVGVVSLTQTIWTNIGDVIVGQSGTGTLELPVFGSVSSVNGVVGGLAGGVGTVNVRGQSGWGMTGNLSVGGLGTGTVNISDASGVSDATTFIGESAGSHGVVSIDNFARLTSTGNVYVGGNASGPGGTGLLQIKDNARLSATTTIVWSTGTMEIAANPMVTGGLTFAGGTLRTMSGTVFTNDATLVGEGVVIDSNGFSSTLGGVFSGSGGLTKISEGSVTLSNASTYTGPTTVNSGKLVVNDSITSVVTVNNGTLGGSGATGGVVAHSGGTVAPGTSPGILTVNGTLTLTMGSTYLVDLNGAAVGKEYDQLNVIGLVSLDDAILSLNLGYVSVPGTLFTIINNDLSDAISGTFADLPEGTKFAAAEQTFTITYHGGDGNDVVLQTIVPEPGTWALLIVGALLLVVFGRRRELRV